ncbi:MAG: sigma-70 family RNA polymerase sigma factor [Hyphomicrobiales bacterium]|nr:sigma-70 family RNA polymerase sigma factor [Hyphomicrobiales bacterium]
MSGERRCDSGIGALLDEAGHQPHLEREEELELVRRADAGDPDAMHRLVGSHLRYVLKIARRYRGWGVPMSDLVQEGTLGFLQAVRRFNPDQGARLSTYASWWIRSSIQDTVLRSWSVVRLGTSNAQKMLAFKLKAMADQVIAANGALSEEAMTWLAKSFGTTVSDVSRLATRMVCRDSLLETARNNETEPRETLSSDLPTPEQICARKREVERLRIMIGDALARLTPREQLVIRKRYLEEVRATFDAIGRELGVSKDRARQLEAAALAKLREALQPLYALGGA